MPVIVYKTLELKVLYVQARRILCEYCRQPFTYVVGERKTFNVTGIPIVSSDEGMQSEATKKAASSLLNDELAYGAAGYSSSTGSRNVSEEGVMLGFESIRRAQVFQRSTASSFPAGRSVSAVS